jgi:uncharacterized protein (DUF1800 family)
MFRSNRAIGLASRALAFAVAAATTVAASAQSLSHGPDLLLHDSFEGITAGPFNDSDAARFLTQATFGPTDADIAHLRSLVAPNNGAGYQAWLNEQYVAPESLMTTYHNWVANTLGENTGNVLREAWFLDTLGGPDPQFCNTVSCDTSKNHTDQLRQRVAFALSEIFVISDQNTLIDQHPEGEVTYYDILSDNAFGNYRTLLEKVTLSTDMGVYLNMVSNPRADLTKNRHPDENYAREINQLFSVGLVMLNGDGSVQTQAGQPVPTYTQPVVTAFAHVFTGWNWASCTSGNYLNCGYQNNDFTLPMAAFAAWHDNGSDATNDIVNKQLLAYPGAVNGGVLAPGGTPQSDLAFALDNIFNHPNVGPFIGKQLIQRLVTSNPSPAYVQRITNVFNNNGSGVRGDLKAVVQAILLDPEARVGQFQAPDSFGKLREPLLRMTHFWRATGALHHCGQDAGGLHYANQPYRYAGYTTAYGTSDETYGSGVGQAPLDSPTVFNFFKPSFVPAGEMATRTLKGPEFQIATDSLIVSSTNSLMGKSFNGDLTDTCGSDPIGDIALNRSQDLALAGSANGGPTDPATALVDAYNKRFMSGQMSPFMRQTLLSYLNTIGSGSGPDWKLQRINRALLLISTSPEYLIQK